MPSDKEITVKILRLLSTKNYMNFLELLIPLKMEREPSRLRNIIENMEKEGLIKENRLANGHVNYSIESTGTKLLSNKKL